MTEFKAYGIAVTDVFFPSGRLVDHASIARRKPLRFGEMVPGLPWQDR